MPAHIMPSHKVTTSHGAFYRISGRMLETIQNREEFVITLILAIRQEHPGLLKATTFDHIQA